MADGCDCKNPICGRPYGCQRKECCVPEDERPSDEPRDERQGDLFARESADVR